MIGTELAPLALVQVNFPSEESHLVRHELVPSRQPGLTSNTLNTLVLRASTQNVLSTTDT